MSSPPSLPCCHQQTVVDVLFAGALPSASRSLHSLVAVGFIALLRIGRSCQFFVVILLQRVIFIFAYIDVVVVVFVVVVVAVVVIVFVGVIDY